MNRSKTVAAKCFVPFCKNTTTNSPEKLFVNVSDNGLRARWCHQLNIAYSRTKRMFCCSNHFDMKDLLYFNEWKLNKKRLALKPTAVLCNNESVDSPSTSHDHQDENQYNTEDIDRTKSSVSSSVLQNLLLAPIENLPRNPVLQTHKETAGIILTNIKASVAVQCKPKTKEASTSAKRGTKRQHDGLPVVPVMLTVLPSTSSSDSKHSMYEPEASDDSADTEIFCEKRSFQYREMTLQLIYNKPKLYLGIPPKFMWLINHIVNQSKEKIQELDIIITLFKLKQNDSVERLCEQLEISNNSFSKSFFKGIQVLASFFQNLIYRPSLQQIKQNLPLAFKIRYSNVQMILDAFEIEIEKPHDPAHQAQTWSNYKNCNTVKYLVGTTPSGFISYISKGFGGRISDKRLVEKSDLLECLPTCSVVMADRGFKEVEALLATKGVKLLRPPSVFSNKKPTKEEVLQTKLIASLRIHVERVIRRLREFKMLKPHSVVNYKHVNYLDYLVLIACGLNNIQNEIIKTA